LLNKFTSIAMSKSSVTVFAEFSRSNMAQQEKRPQTAPTLSIAAETSSYLGKVGTNLLGFIFGAMSASGRFCSLIPG
jgi:hypothetical protein